MSEETVLTCAECAIPKDGRVCRTPEGSGPAGCPTLAGGGLIDAVKAKYEIPHLSEFARQASLQEAANYADMATAPRSLNTRVEEICQFADRMGFKKLGLAFCSGLTEEAKLLNAILVARGFEVCSVICKAGCVPKEFIGVRDEQKVFPGTFEAMCNPIGQAEFLNEAGTELNVMMGLCVGHDSLFLKHVEAYTTVFAVKDRVLGHNPLAALYTSGSYYSRLVKKKPE
jgi:uncharacterized metal-binding protein